MRLFPRADSPKPSKASLFSRLAGVSLVSGLALALGSCQQLDTRQNVGPCPVVGSLYDSARLVEVTGEERHENVGFTASVEGVRGFCRYVGKAPITMELDVDFAFGKGPKAAGDSRTYKYWVAVTRRNQLVLAKQEFTVDVRFPRGADVVRKTETVSGIVIPRATETVSGTNFEVIVGLDLTPEQLAFNRAGKRFRMKVDE